MLTFEYDTQLNILHVFADAEGLAILKKEIVHLDSGSEHTHLMTPSWAGNELNEEKQLENTLLINQVNITYLHQ